MRYILTFNGSGIVDSTNDTRKAMRQWNKYVAAYATLGFIVAEEEVHDGGKTIKRAKISNDYGMHVGFLRLVDTTREL